MVVDILFVVVGAVLLLSGLASVVTRKVFMMGKDALKYTDESLRKYSLPLGISNILSGAGLILENVNMGSLFSIGEKPVATSLIVMIVLLVAGIIVYTAGRKVLVKK